MIKPKETQWQKGLRMLGLQAEKEAAQFWNERAARMSARVKMRLTIGTKEDVVGSQKHNRVHKRWT